MGVICYVLLAGYPPFYDEDQKRLFKKIKEGRYHFHQDYWGYTSPEAINMIQQMLCVDQSQRWTSAQLLQHPWILMGGQTLQAKDLTNSIAVMKKFNARRRLRAAADAVIMANRMNRMLGGAKNLKPEDILRKKVSLIDPDVLADLAALEGGTVGNSEADEFNRIRNRLSFDATSDTDAQDHSVHPALDLLNDKQLDGV
jgi:serine/threonine protein kinase